MMDRAGKVTGHALEKPGMSTAGEAMVKERGWCSGEREYQRNGLTRWLIMLLAAVALLLSSMGWVRAADIPAKPSPGVYVVDQTGTLDSKNQAWINALASQLEQKTTAQLAVLVVKNTGGEAPEDYALQTLRTWGIGQKDKNNGMLLLVATDDKKVRIEVGYGLEGVMNDARAGELLDRYALPYFRQGDMRTGIMKTFAAMATITAQSYQVELTNPSGTLQTGPNGENTSTDLPWWAAPGGIVLLILLAILDFTFFGGRLTSLLLYLLFSGRGGGGGFGGGGRGGGFGGGSGGGGGAGRGW